MDVDLHGPVACQIGYTRKHEVFVTPAGSNEDVFFVSADEGLLYVNRKELTAAGALLDLCARSRNENKEKGGIIANDLNGDPQFFELTNLAGDPVTSYHYEMFVKQTGPNTWAYYDDVDDSNSLTPGDIYLGQGVSTESAHVHTHQGPGTGDGADASDGPSEYDMNQAEAAGYLKYVVDGNCEGDPPDPEGDGPPASNSGPGVYYYDPATMEPYNPVEAHGAASDPIVGPEYFSP